MFGKFLPHPSGVRVKQILLQTLWHQGVKRKQCKASCNLFMKVPPGILQEAPWPQSSVLSFRSSCWQAAPALGPTEGGWCCPSALVCEACGPISIIPGRWGYVSGREYHCVTGRCKPGCLAVPRGNAAPYSWAVDLLVLFPEALLSKSATSHVLESRLWPNSSHMPAIEKRGTGARTWR